MFAAKNGSRTFQPAPTRAPRPVPGPYILWGHKPCLTGPSGPQGKPQGHSDTPAGRERLCPGAKKTWVYNFMLHHCDLEQTCNLSQPD